MADNGSDIVKAAPAATTQTMTREPSRVVVFTGPKEGVGKTTLLATVMGNTRLHGGDVQLGGKSIVRMPIYARASAGLGYVPQEREIFPSLSVRETLEIGSRPGYWTEQRVFDLFPRLQERIGNMGNQLSGGEQQMLSIARALLTNPSVLLMDEPTEGLAPVIVTVSSTAPTCSSAFAVAVNPAVSSMPSRLTVANPGRVNETENVPGGRSTIL